MKKERHLKGQGEFVYDYKHDLLTFKVKDRDYKMSVEAQNFIIDIDTEDFVTGIRIFDASRVSNLDKFVFKNLIHGEFNASIKDKVITVRLNFVGKMRNKLLHIFPSPIAEEKNFTQQVTAPIETNKRIRDSTVIIPEIIA